MSIVFDVHWKEVLPFTVPVLEIILRGTVMYLAIYLMLRFILMRQAGAVGIADMLVIVLVADAAQNAMADGQTSLPDGLLLVATIIGWSYALDWLAYHFSWFQWIVTPPPLSLVKDGRMLRRNMRQELITQEELMAQLRLQGVEHVGEVRAAYMESDGRISVIKFEPDDRANSERRKM